MTNHTYRLKQTVHPAAPRYRAWESLNYQAALKLWARLEAHDQPGQWFAVRIKKWDDTAQDEGLYFAGPTYHELFIDLDVIPLAGAEPPRYAPNYEEMPTARLVLTAGQELTGRVRRWFSRRFR